MGGRRNVREPLSRRNSRAQTTREDPGNCQGEGAGSASVKAEKWLSSPSIDQPPTALLVSTAFGMCIHLPHFPDLQVRKNESTDALQWQIRLLWQDVRRLPLFENIPACRDS